METLKYTIIKSDSQYIKYCNALEKLDLLKKKSKAQNDEIELLILLIEKYDEENNCFEDSDPIQILKSLMKDHKMKSIDLAKLLNVSEGLVSDMLRYKKGISKESIRILSDHFKLSQEAFNRPYKLIMNTEKKTKNKSTKPH